MSTFVDTDYKKYLLPRRFIFFDLDGTIIPSTAESGRRIAISLSTYQQVQTFALEHLKLPALPSLNEEQCSLWYRANGGPQGLIKKVLEETPMPAEVKECLSFYFNGLFNQRLTRYLREDLKHDTVPQSHLEFLKSLADRANMILVSYRYQSQFDFLNSLEDLGLSQGSLFGPNNAFAVGGPGTSSDGSKSRFVGAMWKHEIRAQRRLTSDIGKTFPPIVIGDSIRDVQFAVDIGGIFFGVSETGEDSHDSLVAEIKSQGENLSSRSRVFDSLADPQLQKRLLEECDAYRETVAALNKQEPG
ncbi:MAG: phosphoglycolate phosphatase-like HAD superfamily hydrolase [Planctomycetota bacterium]|jgi:phosphoglycolate phosphatase-like HAD superfamily hydrolase